MKRIKRANQELKSKIADAAIAELTRINIQSGEDYINSDEPRVCPPQYDWNGSVDYYKPEGYTISIRYGDTYVAYLEDGEVVLIAQS